MRKIVKVRIAWTVVPDNDATLQRWIGDRAIGGSIEPDDDIVISDSIWTPIEQNLGHLDIAERVPGFRRSGSQGQSCHCNGDQYC